MYLIEGPTLVPFSMLVEGLHPGAGGMAQLAANLNAQLEQEAGEELQAYKTLQGHVEQLLQSRGRFVQQRVENEAVRDELALDEGATVYKTVGPVLFKQDYDEVKENVAKRLEFIAKEVQKVDDQVKAKQDEQQKIGELIMKKQTELRAKAAEAGAGLEQRA